MIRVTEGKKGKRYSARVHLGSGKYKMLGTFGTRKEARKAEAKWEMERSAPEKVLCRDYAKRFLAHYKETRKISSYDLAKSAIDYWLKDFGNRSLHTLTREECREWATTANKRGKLNRWAARPVITMLNEAVDEGLIDRNPMKGTAIQTRGNRDRTPLTVDEVERLAQIAGSLWDQDIEAFVRFLAYSGMRSGEVFALAWEDINFDTGRVRVGKRLYKGDLDLPKTNKINHITLLPEAREALNMVERESEWIFTGVRGSRMTRSQLVYYWKPITAAFGREVKAHELRHFLGHHLYVTLGYPARVAAKQLTHATPHLIETTYGHGDHGALEEIERTYEERSKVIPLRRARSA